MYGFSRFLLAAWVFTFFTGWLLTGGRMMLDGHWFLGALLSVPCTWAIHVGIELTDVAGGEPPREDEKTNAVEEKPSKENDPWRA